MSQINKPERTNFDILHNIDLKIRIIKILLNDKSADMYLEDRFNMIQIINSYLERFVNESNLPLDTVSLKIDAINKLILKYTICDEPIDLPPEDEPYNLLFKIEKIILELETIVMKKFDEYFK